MGSAGGNRHRVQRIHENAIKGKDGHVFVCARLLWRFLPSRASVVVLDDGRGVIGGAEAEARFDSFGK
jgi:hypothetical protein